MELEVCQWAIIKWDTFVLSSDDVIVSLSIQSFYWHLTLNYPWDSVCSFSHVPHDHMGVLEIKASLP